MRKLLDIAMALTRKPRLLLLDEPTSGVCAEEKFPTMDRVMEAARRARPGRCSSSSTTWRSCSAYADRVIAFYGGRVIADGAPTEVLRAAEVRRYVTGRARMSAPLLAVEDLHVAIQSMEALRGFSLAVAGGRHGRPGRPQRRRQDDADAHRHGPSGRRPRPGALRGQDLAAVPPHGRAPLGIGYMPEDRQLVPELTVEENILLPAWVSRTGDGRRATGPRLRADARARARCASARRCCLSGGQQKLVALGRALVAGTRLLLLDEPFEGVAPALSERLSEVIARLKGTDLAVVVAQSDLNHAQALFDREYVIERGANGPDRRAA